MKLVSPEVLAHGETFINNRCVKVVDTLVEFEGVASTWLKRHEILVRNKINHAVLALSSLKTLSKCTYISGQPIAAVVAFATRFVQV